MPASPVTCTFCKIAQGTIPAFKLYEDDLCLAFLDRQPVREGHAMVIPKAHIDHFSDLDGRLSTHILAISQRLARKMHDVLKPLRVGYVVSGFGVPHAHFHVIPLWDLHDITSAQYLDTSRTPPVFTEQVIPVAPEAEREAMSLRLRLDF